MNAAPAAQCRKPYVRRPSALRGTLAAIAGAARALPHGVTSKSACCVASELLPTHTV